MNTIEIGPVKVVLLEAQSPLLDQATRENIDEQDWEYAQTIAAESRRREFLRSRWLLCRLLGRVWSISRDGDRLPKWPAGWVGSLSHKEGNVACALTNDTNLLSIGIDLEREAVNVNLEQHICQNDESSLMNVVCAAGESRKKILSLIFSFKEAVFKCHFPIGKSFFYFHDLSVTAIDLNQRLITGRLEKATSASTPAHSLITGWFAHLFLNHQPYVLTVATMEHTWPGRLRLKRCLAVRK